MKAFFSNRLENLAEALAERLFIPGASPFERRCILVPSVQIKEFLTFYLASRLSIAAGMRIVSLEQALPELLAADQKRLPSFIELSLLIEEQIHFCLREEGKIFDSLKEYLSESDPLRIVALSDQIAHLFLRYGLYSEKFLSEWLAKKGWQQKIWHALFSADGPLTFPLEALSDQRAKKASIHLFGFSYLPSCYLDFFSASDAVLYQLSACAQYWEDCCSDRERLNLSRWLQGKEVKESIREELELYLQDRHPLLANWGKYGREFLKSLDLDNLDAHENYEVNSHTRLAQLQKSILHLEKYVDTEKDDSIQIHSAPSKLREVEVLKSVILTLLSTSDMQPSDVLVLAPDITTYAPYIQMVFDQSSLAYNIEGLKEGTLSDFAQGFFHFLSLSGQELNLSSAMKLFFCRPFRERWGFSLEQVNLIHSWLKRAHIRSGEESWEAGIDRLLWGLAMSSDPQQDDLHHPLSCIAQTDSELFDAFLSCLQAVKRDLGEIAPYQTRTLPEWLECVEKIALRHFACESENELLLRELRALYQNMQRSSSFHCSFVSIQRVLRHFFERRTGSILAKHLQAVRFSSLSNGTPRPARIIYVLGLDEESFPRYESINSLCALSTSAHCSYIPTMMDKDRYLFLELLSSARDHLILSYVRVCPQDNKPRGASYLIEELCDYIGSNTSSITHHPSFSIPDIRMGKRPDFFAIPESAECICPSLPDAEDVIISLSSLRKLAKNPIQFYFNEALGMYLQHEETLERDPFSLSALNRYKLKRLSLSHPFEKVIDASERSGMLPEGLFRQVAVLNLQSQIEENEQTFEAFSVELSLQCREAVRQKNGNWILPALSIQFQKNTRLHLVGKLDLLTAQGMLVNGKKDLESLLSVYPLYLVFLHLKKHFEEIPSTLLFTTCRAVFPYAPENYEHLLNQYLEYYYCALGFMSPFLPKWASSLLQNQRDKFEKDMHNALSKEPLFFADPYLEWMRKAHITIDEQKMFAAWAPYLQQYFGGWHEF